MLPIKEWYKSKTIIAGILIVILSILGIDDNEGDLYSTVMANMDSITEAVLGVMAIWGRLRAKSTIQAPATLIGQRDGTVAHTVPANVAAPNAQAYTLNQQVDGYYVPEARG